MQNEHSHPQGDPDPGDESTQDLPILSNHIQRWWGDVPIVFHELVSDYIHLDLHIVQATEEQPYHVVITTGMSDRPMIPKMGGPPRYCELVMALPADWPIEEKQFVDEKFWWPFRHLKQTARFPHVSNKYIWCEHTIANEEPLEPFHDSVPFCGSILSIPMLCPEEAWSVHVRKDKEVFFFSWLPLYERELKYAHKHGSEALLEQLEVLDVTELIQVDRGCAV